MWIALIAPRACLHCRIATFQSDLIERSRSEWRSRVLDRKPTVSVVIIALNEEGTIRRCIKSVLDQTVVVDEIVVVDGGSTDYTMRYVADLNRSHGDVLSTVEEPDTPNRGPAFARNTGAERTSSDLVLFLNGDVILGPEYLARLLAEMDDRQLDAVSGRLWNVRSTLVNGLANVNHALEYSNAKVDGNEPPLRSHALLVNASTFWRVGGYEPALPSGEDEDLHRRLKALGIRFGVCESATIWHESKGHRSFSDWIKQTAWQARGTAAQSKNPDGRRGTESSDFRRDLLLPLSLFAAALLMVVIISNLIGGWGWLTGAAVFTAATTRYLRSASDIQLRCSALTLPTAPAPQDTLLYPLFAALRSTVMVTLVWQASLVPRSIEEIEHTEDKAA